MIKYMLVFWLILCTITGCSSAETPSELPEVESQTVEKMADETEEKEPLITYEDAFDYISEAEQVIINANKDSVNKLKENAAEKIIYSDEYAALYCSYWRALEELEGERDSRFGKSKMRWQMDFSNDEWTNILKETIQTEGVTAFQDEYYRIYDEEVFPKVQYRWENGIVN